MKHTAALCMTTLFIGSAAAQASLSTVPGDTPPGITTFHAFGSRFGSLAGLKNPYVSGGELILFWNDIEAREGVYDWSAIDSGLAAWGGVGKRLDVRIATAHGGPNYTPDWVFEKYGVRRIGRGLFADFENDAGYLGVPPARSGPYALGPQAVYATGLGHASQRAAAVSAPNLQRTLLLSLTPRGIGAPAMVDANTTYGLQFDFSLSPDARGLVEIVTTQSGTMSRQEFAFSAPAAPVDHPQAPASFHQSFHVPPHSDYSVSISAQGPGSLTVDNVLLLKIVPENRWVDAHFESAQDFGPWLLASGAKHVSDTTRATEGKGAVALDHRGSDFAPALVSDPGIFPFHRGEAYSARTHYRAETTATLVFQLKNDDGIVEFSTTKTVSQGTSGKWNMYNPSALRYSGLRAQLGILGPGKVCFDEIGLVRWSDRVTVFPDYFDPKFHAAWQRLIQAFAQRYAEDSRLGRVCIGGFGRWEECILDAEEDGHGVLVPQWRARGYTHDRYLARIVQCMDLFRSVFPTHALRVCLAYGLFRNPEEGIIYRGVAAAAKARSIGLKQNGLSERYDSWDDNTHTSYLYARYNKSPLDLTYETGGQIVNNTLNAHGHPISLLNRAVIDGIDHLFLYGSDVEARHVAACFPAAQAQMGRAGLPTQFFVRLGAYPLLNEHSASPVQYRHLWMGIRPCEELMPLSLHEFQGEPCVRTSSGSLILDLDERRLRAGMWSGSITFEYLDQGTDSMALRIWNRETRTSQQIAQLNKANSGNWRPWTVALPSWFLQSSQDGGSDTLRDIELVDLGDGPEVVRGAELDMVPAEGWRMKPLAHTAASETSIPLEALASAGFILPDGPCMVTVPLDGSDVAADVDVRILRQLPGQSSWDEVARKQVQGCAGPVDVRFALLGDNSSRAAYRITARATTGTFCWLTTEPPNPTIRVEQYETYPVVVRTSDLAATNRGSVLAFQADEPFCGIEFKSSATSLTLQRQAYAGTWLSELTLSGAQHTTSTALSVWKFAPEPPGTYRIMLPDSGPREIHLRVLRREIQPQATQQMPSGADTNLIAWDGTVSSAPAAGMWQAAAGLKAVDASAWRVEGAHPTFASPSSLNLLARPNQRLTFRLKNASPAALVRLFWSDESGNFSASRSTFIPVVPNDTQLRDYYWPVGLERQWTGRIQQLRLEVAAGLSPGGVIQFQPVALTQPEVLRQWSFHGDPVDMMEVFGGAQMTTSSDGLLVKAGASGGGVLSPPLAVRFEAEPEQVLHVRLRNLDGAKRIWVKWARLGHISDSGDELLIRDQELRIPIDLVAGSEPKEYSIPVGAAVGWKNTILRMGLWFDADAGEGRRVEIEHMEIRAR